MPSQSGKVYGLTLLCPILDDPMAIPSHDLQIRGHLAELPTGPDSPFAIIEEARDLFYGSVEGLDPLPVAGGDDEHSGFVGLHHHRRPRRTPEPARVTGRHRPQRG